MKKCVREQKGDERKTRGKKAIKWDEAVWFCATIRLK